MIRFLIVAMCSLLSPTASAAEAVCSADGTCVPVEENVVIPRAANTEGAAPELVVECIDKHPNCPIYEKQDQCVENPGWMIVNCPASCKACHLRDRKVRCAREFLNMTDIPPAFEKPGDVDATFTRIVDTYKDTFGITVHSRDPWVLTFDNFLSSEEADAMIKSVRTWERSTDTGAMNEHGETGRKLSTGRTSSNAWCRKECESDSRVQQVMRRIEEVTMVPFENSESFQILRYENGQKYNAHHDSSTTQFQLPCGPRVLTFYLYLSDVEEGGETAFPNLGIAVKPQKGKAVLWPGVTNDNPQAIDHRTLHEARPVIKGTKYGANSWIHMYNFRIPNLWGCTGSFD